MNTHAMDADTNVDVNADMIARQGPSGPFNPPGNHWRSAPRKTAQPTLKTYQQTMCRDDKDLEADSKEVDSAIQARAACIFISLNK